MNIKSAVLSAVSFGSVMLVCSMAHADENDRRAGTRGHVTAWEPGRTSVIDVDPCPSSGRFSYDYAACGKRFRVKINEQLCRLRGSGNHRWRYQIGASFSTTLMTARCE